MRARDDHTRYGLPPERAPFEPFPAEIPWDTPISDLSSWWLEIRAGDVTSRYPLRLMAAEQGWQVTLREIVPRLRSASNGRPESILLLKRGDLDIGKSENAGKWLTLKDGWKR
jgi:hypothetical protein